MKKNFLVFLIFLLGGCATMTQDQRTMTGTGAGAVIGAGIGKLLGNSWEAAAIGAVGGGIAGNTIANLLSNQQNDEQTQPLKQQKNNNPQNEDELVKKLYLGSETLSGTTCDGETKVIIEFTGFPKRVMFGGPVLRVYGKFHSTNFQGNALETNVKGLYFINSKELRVWGDVAPLLSDFGSDFFGSGIAGTHGFQKAKMHKDFPKFIEKYKPYIREYQEIYIPETPLAIDIIHDSGGEGWIGAFEGRGFEDCREVILAGENATASGILPPMTEKQALRIVDHVAVPDGGSKGRTDINKLYWLNIAAENGSSFQTISKIDQILQKQGKTSPLDYQKVVKNYQLFANDGDQRAQRALAKMYAEGRGVSKNSAESERLFSLANDTLDKAKSVCTSPKVLQTVTTLKQMHTQNARVLGMFVGAMLGGMQLDPGNIRITEIVINDVASMDKPFTCSVYGERIGANFDASTMPEVEYYSVDGYGNYTYMGSNSGDIATKQIAANFAQSLAGRSYESEIKLESLGNMRYKLETQRDTVMVDLN